MQYRELKQNIGWVICAVVIAVIAINWLHLVAHNAVLIFKLLKKLYLKLKNKRIRKYIQKN